MIDRIGYLLAVLGWSVVWFLAGVWATLTVQRLERIADALDPHPSGATVTTEAAPRRRQLSSKIRIIVGVVVMLLAVVSVVGTAIQQHRITELVVANEERDKQARELVRCLSAYANNFADALEARGTANNEAQAALDTLITRIDTVMNNPDPRNPSAARQEFRTAVGDFLDARQKAKEQQLLNPFPQAVREC